MKKVGNSALLLLLCAVMVFAAACGQSGETAAGGREITLVNNKPETDEALRNFAAVFESQTGIRVTIRTFGGETPYAPNLMAMFNGGMEPELFVFEGRAGYEDARNSGRLSDLSTEPWVRDTNVAFTDPVDGKIVGFPVAIEGWGLGYNKDILARAGVDPASLVNIEGIRAAFTRIESMRAQLGLDAVVSMAAGPGMTWVTGLHGLNGYLALGLAYDDTTYIDMMLRGEVDNTRLTRFAEYYDLLFRHSNRNTLLTGGYDQQIGDFAVGRTAFLHQGNWTDPTFAELGVSFEMGYVPHAFLPETTDGIFVGAPSWYILNARANPQGIEDAKQFLIAMASTPEGHDYMVNRAGMVPAYNSVRLQPPGQFSRAVQEYANAGRIYAWQQNELPDGFGMNILGPIFAQLAAGQIDVQGFVRLVTQATAEIR